MSLLTVFHVLQYHFILCFKILIRNLETECQQVNRPIGCELAALQAVILSHNNIYDLQNNANSFPYVANYCLPENADQWGEVV